MKALRKVSLVSMNFGMTPENLVALPLERARELLGDAEISITETAPPRGREELGNWRVLRARERNGAWELTVAREQVSQARRAPEARRPGIEKQR